MELVMIIRDEDIFVVQMVALHPDGDGFCGGSVPVDRRAQYGSKPPHNWMAGGKVDKGETPVEAAIREFEEEGWLLPKDAKVYEVYRGIKKGFGKLSATLCIYSIVVCETTPIPLADYKEKHRGVEQRKLSIEEVHELWEPECEYNVVVDIHKRLLKGERDIKPINRSNKGNWFIY